MNILVLCTGNSARSILLEGILGGLSEHKTFSAGSKPVGKVNSGAIRVLERHGLAIDSPSSKSWDIFASEGAPKMDLVITVCGNARDEECPFWPGAPLQTHWGVEDPADVTHPKAAVDQAFEEAFEVLHHRALAFLKLDWEQLNHQERRSALDEIGRLLP